ncbi:MAG: hypothetical protein IJA15_06805 [Clostridia bacterium]|nr:hypothetical protein [Clostridia bacterium]
MRKFICTILAIICVASLAVFVSGCGPTLEEFTANESRRYVEVGETFSVPRPTAKDSKGNMLIPEVTAVDPDGETVQVKNYTFKPDKVGMYKVTYTVTVGKTTESKSFDLEVYDETEPLVDIGLQWYNITVVGTTFDTKEITATDNSGEEITPEVTVYFNDEEVELDNGVVTFSEVGTYKVNVTAVDSSSNKEERDYIVWTKVTYEDDVFVENQFYANQTSTDFAKNGEQSMKIDLFANQPTYNWFNDISMLGELYFYGNTEENPFTHVAYWIYFDFEGIDVVGSSSVNGEWYATTVYDIYGREVAKNSQDKYEFNGNTWYRVVSDLTATVNPIDHPEAGPVTTCLMDYGIFFGLWNFTEGNNLFSKPVKVYIDDICIIDPENDNEVYEEAPTPPEEMYEKGERLAFVKFGDMVHAVGTTNGADASVTVNDEVLVTYNLKHGSVMGGPQLFDSYASDLLGTSTETSANEDKRAFALGWRIFTGNNDAFIYEITANKTVYIDLKAQTQGVDGAEGTTDGWVWGGNASTITVYVKDANGVLTKMYSWEPSSGPTGVDELGIPTGAEVLGVLLEAGETLYYEYNFPWVDHRNITNPVYLNVYEAVEKA